MPIYSTVFEQANALPFNKSTGKRYLEGRHFDLAKFEGADHWYRKGWGCKSTC